MSTGASPLHRVVQRLQTQDPERDALRQAVRAAITVPLVAGFSMLVVGGSQAPLYAVVGAFWIMVLTDIPGNRQNRAVAYIGLCLNGLVLITVGTLVAPVAWLAVALVFLLGVAVTLAGGFSETMSAGQRATLVLYFWPVSTPVGPISDRLLGWLIAVAICVPALLFLLPPGTTATCAVTRHKCAPRWPTGLGASARPPP